MTEPKSSRSNKFSGLKRRTARAPSVLLLLAFLPLAAEAFQSQKTGQIKPIRYTICSKTRSGGSFLFQSTSAAVPPSLSPSTTTSTASSRKKRLATGMAFLTGWADVVFLKRYQTFATILTGNTLWLANALMEQKYRVAGYYAAVIVSYLFGLAAFRRMDLTLRKRCMRVCALVTLCLFVGSDILYIITNRARLPSVMMLAAAFGVVNSIGSEVAGTLTFVVTGHITRMTHIGVDRFSRKRGRKRLSESDKDIVKQNSLVVLGFVVGALFGNFSEAKQHPGAFSVLGLLYASLFYWIDMERIGGAWWLRPNKQFCEVEEDGIPCPEDVVNSTATTDT